MRFVLTAALLLALSGCGYVTPKLDETTGTTLAQRCGAYQAAITMREAAVKSGQDLTGHDLEALQYLRIIRDMTCVPAEAVAAGSVPAPAVPPAPPAPNPEPPVAPADTPLVAPVG